ncbi:MAG TPA: hypothetical protein VHX14_19580 [Thermoanaerobaculia bacterium]|nr:hypothetical protein [Thermoanaerobaculia bacterium]
MRYIDHNGEDGTVQVGEACSGVGFAVITITYADVADPYFLAWFLAEVHSKFVSPIGVKH